MIQLLIKIIKELSFFELAVRQDVIPVHILVAEFTDVYCLPVFPLVNRRFATFLFFPIPIDKMGSMAVGLLSNSDLLFVYTIVLTLRVLIVVNASDSVRMTA